MEHTLDATNQRLGRLASNIARILQGKHCATYAPRLSGTDRVTVIHASKITIGGAKAVQKIYYRHTGYMGHLREKNFKTAFEQSPKAVLLHAVYNMLPKNRLRPTRLKRLTIQL